jgi:ATP-dependent helicase/nuclease subunit B
MSTRFVLGKPATGKTRWCFDQIVESLRAQPLGPPIFWLLPRQATFQAQRMLACSLGGYFRVQAVSFEDLGEIILGECGGAGIPEITDAGRRMILGHLLRKHANELRFFGNVAHQPGLAAEIDATFDELQRCGQDAEELPNQVEHATSALNAKLHDLQMIQSVYASFLGQDRLDSNRRLREALSSIKNCALLCDADIYVDGFYEFTHHERKVLAALAKVCRSMAVTLPIDPQSPVIANPHHLPSDMSDFHRTEDAYRRLSFAFQEDSVAMETPVIYASFPSPGTPGEGQCGGLRAEATDKKPPPQPSPGVPGEGEKRSTGSRARCTELLEAPDRRAEVDAAARWINDQVAKGKRYRDVTVLMRSEDDYRDLITASFAENGIPFFIDRRRTAAHHPLLRLIRASLSVARSKWSHDAMMAVLKTSLVDLSAEETDELENYVLAHGIHHTVWITPEPWNSGEDEAAASVDALRRKVVERLQPFVRAVTQSPISVKSLAKAIFDLLESFDVRGQIVKWMNEAEQQGRLEERGEHERVWDELVKLFDEMVELFADEAVHLDDFCAILDAALEAFDLAIAPPTVDQVLIGPVDRTRTQDIRAAVVLGLAEGQFPRLGREGTVFTDADRRMLAKNKVDLDPDTQRRLLDEYFLAQIALTRASENLLLTRATADEGGQELGASAIWRQIADEGITPQKADREPELPLRSLATPRQLIVSLMRWVRTGGNEDSNAAVYQWLATDSKLPPDIDSMRRLGWAALSRHNKAELDPRRAAELFPSPLRATVGQLESFRRCPYQHFARWGLGLRPRANRQVGGADLSGVYHDVLERIAMNLIEQKTGFAKLDDADTRQQIAQLVQQSGHRRRGRLMLSTGKNRYLLSRVEQTLASVIATQRGLESRGKFRPVFANVQFGGSPGSLPPISVMTPKGNRMELRGKIDRIDQLPTGGAAVIDYRLRAARLNPAEAFHGLALQLIANLLVLEALDGSPTPAAALCMQLLRDIRPALPEDVPDPDDPLFALQSQPRGVFDFRFLKDFDSEAGEGWSRILKAHVKKDGTPGNPESTDSCDSRQFAALLRHTRKRIGELADRIIAGQIDIRPYRLGDQTPCAHCEFRALCRFEPAPGGYDDLEPMKRQDLLRLAMEENP